MWGANFILVPDKKYTISGTALQYNVVFVYCFGTNLPDIFFVRAVTLWFGAQGNVHFFKDIAV